MSHPHDMTDYFAHRILCFPLSQQDWQAFLTKKLHIMIH